ncbi:HAD family hydrolase [Loigolactobacillus backii]|uniref:Uncharacterized protein n=1 Tax=Loigolactobacillus backii TaxID=375175 RepID=A0A192GZ74_9LACO|nr:HAD-IA family hydrolase [Loigolactobacillus backii]ANK58938.1 hypothetical protein AYR52_00840 [Loigolactobacillus backii]ANK61390.1 hypothetical protein AYR53_00635 [Loigolactobacillus backii]ANK63926.1 hypothetical protein AYR54_00825 [Loigolactobacillus backii]ANK66374.1 hypothetical protein AYR55_00830 [Loigolactobacillus backii]ANK69410.1 hypothetical protein AYR56_04080 [Loigolactobacillus backii]
MKNFIFDVDGTLIDTIDMYIPALRATLADYGYQRDYAGLTDYFGMNGWEALPLIGVSEQDRQPIYDQWAKLSAQNTAKIKLYPEIEQVLAKLAATPGIKLVIATSKSKEELSSHLGGKFAILKYFDAAVTCEETTRHKPYPDPIEKGMTKIAAKPAETIYIGDSEFDVQAAQAAKAKSGAALWGATQPERLKAAEYQLKQPSDLLKLI